MNDRNRKKMNDISERFAAALAELLDGKIALAINCVVVFKQPGGGIAVAQFEQGRALHREMAAAAAQEIHGGTIRPPDDESTSDLIRSHRN